MPYDPKEGSIKYFTSIFPSFYVAYVRFILYQWLLTVIHKTCSICYPNSFQPLTLYPLAYLLTVCCCPASRYHSSLSAVSLDASLLALLISSLKVLRYEKQQVPLKQNIHGIWYVKILQVCSKPADLKHMRKLVYSLIVHIAFIRLL